MSQQEIRVLFAMNLYDYMHSRGVSRKDLSEATGIPYTTICNWLQATRFPRPEQLDKIAAYLHLTRAELLDEGLENYEEMPHHVSKDDLRFAFWGDAEEMSDEDVEDVLKYAEFVRQKKQAK